MYENKSAKETLESFSVIQDQGLSDEEVLKRRQEYGPNKLNEKPKDPWYKIFWGNIKDPMTGILAIAAIISLVLAIIEMSRRPCRRLHHLRRRLAERYHRHHSGNEGRKSP